MNRNEANDGAGDKRPDGHLSDLAQGEAGARESCEELGVTPPTLDAAAERVRQPEDTTDDPTLESWPTPVDLDDTLVQIAAAQDRLVKMPDEALVVVPLWVAHTYCYDCFDFSPILHFQSPTKRCGKSRALSLLEKLVWRPLRTANASAAALFRVIENSSPTCLIDEWDSVCRERNPQAAALRNLLNAGFQRGSPCLRCTGTDREPRIFRVFCPKAVTSVGDLPDTAADRAIALQMKRKLTSERVSRLRDFTPTDLQRMLARWAEDNAEALRQARPSIPGALDDRAADIWEPLFAIADLAGGDWPHWSRETAVALSSRPESDESWTLRLLRDIRTVFRAERAERLETDRLLRGLTEMTGSPWATCCHGRPLTAHRLGRTLVDFGIAHRRWKSPPNGSPRGFYRADFDDAWARYLPA